MMKIEHLKLAQKALRDQLLAMGYSTSMASELTSGKKTPSLERAAEIEAVTGIPAAAWAKKVPLQEMWDQITKGSKK